MKESVSFDVVVIGGGPAGISACLALAGDPGVRVALLESEPELGGMPRSCHIFFGMRDRGWLRTGPSYARKLDRLLRNTSIRVRTHACVLRIEPDEKGERHRTTFVSPSGVEIAESRYVVLATGCYERSREARRIPGTRPAGIYTTGALQQIVNLRGRTPGQRAVVVGSEHVALSSVLTLRRAGVSIAGLIEEDADLHTYPLPAAAMSRFLGFPLHRRTRLRTIRGKRRVEGVEVLDGGTGEGYAIACDTVIVTGGFRPDSALIYGTVIQEDPQSLGPVVDMNYMTSVRNIYAAGNILRGADMHDLCALEGRRVGENILRELRGDARNPERWVSIRAAEPIRYVVPQRISTGKAKQWKSSLLSPGVSFQAARTLKGVTVEARSGNDRVWHRSYARILAHTRMPIPIERFRWNLVDPEKGVTIGVVHK